MNTIYNDRFLDSLRTVGNRIKLNLFRFRDSSGNKSEWFKFESLWDEEKKQLLMTVTPEEGKEWAAIDVYSLKSGIYPDYIAFSIEDITLNRPIKCHFTVKFPKSTVATILTSIPNEIQEKQNYHPSAVNMLQEEKGEYTYPTRKTFEQKRSLDIIQLSEDPTYFNVLGEKVVKSERDSEITKIELVPIGITSDKDGVYYVRRGETVYLGGHIEEDIYQTVSGNRVKIGTRRSSIRETLLRSNSESVTINDSNKTINVHRTGGAPSQIYLTSKNGRVISNIIKVIAYQDWRVEYTSNLTEGNDVVFLFDNTEGNTGWIYEEGIENNISQISIYSTKPIGDRIEIRCNDSRVWRDYFTYEISRPDELPGGEYRYDIMISTRMDNNPKRNWTHIPFVEDLRSIRSTIFVEGIEIGEDTGFYCIQRGIPELKFSEMTNPDSREPVIEFTDYSPKPQSFGISGTPIKGYNQWQIVEELDGFTPYSQYGELSSLGISSITGYLQAKVDGASSTSSLRIRRVNSSRSYDKRYWKDIIYCHPSLEARIDFFVRLSLEKGVVDTSVISGANDYYPDSQDQPKSIRLIILGTESIHIPLNRTGYRVEGMTIGGEDYPEDPYVSARIDGSTLIFENKGEVGEKFSESYPCEPVIYTIGGDHHNPNGSRLVQKFAVIRLPQSLLGPTISSGDIEFTANERIKTITVASSKEDDVFSRWYPIRKDPEVNIGVTPGYTGYGFDGVGSTVASLETNATFEDHQLDNLVIRRVPNTPNNIIGSLNGFYGNIAHLFSDWRHQLGKFTDISVPMVLKAEEPSDTIEVSLYNYEGKRYDSLKHNTVVGLDSVGLYRFQVKTNSAFRISLDRLHEHDGIYLFDPYTDSIKKNILTEDVGSFNKIDGVTVWIAYSGTSNQTGKINTRLRFQDLNTNKSLIFSFKTSSLKAEASTISEIDEASINIPVFIRNGEATFKYKCRVPTFIESSSDIVTVDKYPTPIMSIDRFEEDGVRGYIGHQIKVYCKTPASSYPMTRSGDITVKSLEGLSLTKPVYYPPQLSIRLGPPPSINVPYSSERGDNLNINATSGTILNLKCDLYKQQEDRPFVSKVLELNSHLDSAVSADWGYRLKFGKEDGQVKVSIVSNPNNDGPSVEDVVIGEFSVTASLSLSDPYRFISDYSLGNMDVVNNIIQTLGISNVTEKFNANRLTENSTVDRITSVSPKTVEKEGGSVTIGIKKIQSDDRIEINTNQYDFIESYEVHDNPTDPNILSVVVQYKSRLEASTLSDKDKEQIFKYGIDLKGLIDVTGIVSDPAGKLIKEFAVGNSPRNIRIHSGSNHLDTKDITQNPWNIGLMIGSKFFVGERNTHTIQVGSEGGKVETPISSVSVTAVDGRSSCKLSYFASGSTALPIPNVGIDSNEKSTKWTKIQIDDNEVVSDNGGYKWEIVLPENKSLQDASHIVHISDLYGNHVEVTYVVKAGNNFTARIFNYTYNPHVNVATKESTGSVYLPENAFIDVDQENHLADIYSNNVSRNIPTNSDGLVFDATGKYRPGRGNRDLWLVTDLSKEQLSSYGGCFSIQVEQNPKITVFPSGYAGGGETDGVKLDNKITLAEDTRLDLVLGDNERNDKTIYVERAKWIDRNKKEWHCYKILNCSDLKISQWINEKNETDRELSEIIPGRNPYRIEDCKVTISNIDQEKLNGGEIILRSENIRVMVGGFMAEVLTETLNVGVDGSVKIGGFDSKGGLYRISSVDLLGVPLDEDPVLWYPNNSILNISKVVPAGNTDFSDNTYRFINSIPIKYARYEWKYGSYTINDIGWKVIPIPTTIPDPIDSKSRINLTELKGSVMDETGFGSENKSITPIHTYQSNILRNHSDWESVVGVNLNVKFNPLYEGVNNDIVFVSTDALSLTFSTKTNTELRKYLSNSTSREGDELEDIRIRFNITQFVERLSKSRLIEELESGKGGYTFGNTELTRLTPEEKKRIDERGKFGWASHRN